MKTKLALITTLLLIGGCQLNNQKKCSGNCPGKDDLKSRG